jgi:cytochrome c-type biogenesis protein
MELETVPLLLAFAAGVASFVSPCHLAVVPAFLGVLGRTATAAPDRPDRWVLVHRAGLFVLGFSLVMVALGMSVGLAGYLLWDQMPVLRKIGGVLLLVFGIHTIGLLQIPLLFREFRWHPTTQGRSGDLSAFVTGLVMGVGWTPCVGPVLAAILLLAAETATVWQGGLLLAVYSAGLGIPFLTAGLFLGRSSGFISRVRRHSGAVEMATGSVLMAMGVLLYTNQFQRVAALLGTWAPL